MRRITCLCLLLLAELFLSQPGRAEKEILFLGDSLTAGLGVAVEEAYPFLLGEMLKRDGFSDVGIINGGASGSTSASAVGRLRWYAARRPAVLFLALGANDGLRGLRAKELEKNLEGAIRQAKEAGMAVMLAGMEVPPNYGEEYAGSFRKVFRDLASRHQVAFIPFLLEGVAGVPALNQADGIHPNAEGQKKIALHVYPYLKRQLLGDTMQNDQ